MKIAVLGAGLVGLASAHALADEGHTVLVIDREGPASGASRGNAGWLAHTDIDPIAHPKMLRQVPKFLSDPLGPLAIRKEYLLPVLPWLIRLLIASRPANLARSIDALIALQSLAMPAWDALSARLGMGHMIHRRGGLFAFKSHDDFRSALPHLKRQETAGIRVDYLDGPEVRQMEPALTDAIAGAAYFPDAAHVSDPYLVTMALYEAARARSIDFLQAHVKAVEPGPNIAVRFEGREPLGFDRVVVAMGAWSKKIAAGLGDPVPLDTERGYNISFPGSTRYITRPVSIQGEGFVVTPLDTGLRIGGAVELGGLKLPPNHARTRALHKKAERFIKDLPGFEQGTLWMGHRPSIPDSLPVIGRATRSDAVIYAFGHGHYGLTQSAATARLVADLVAGRDSPIPLPSFSPKRF
jgi:D-amino-acid dehydrogenase